MDYIKRVLVFWLTFLLATVVDYSTFTLQFDALAWFIDIPSLVIVSIPAWYYAISSTPPNSYALSRKLIKIGQLQATQKERDNAISFIRLFGNISLLMGVIWTATSFIIIGRNLDDLSTIGPASSVAFLPLLYGLISKALCYVAEERIVHITTIVPEGLSMEISPKPSWGKVAGVLIGILLLMGSFTSYFFMEEDSNLNEQPYFLSLGEFTVTIKDGKRLKTQIQLLLSDELPLEFLVIRRPQVEDIIITELRNLSAKEVMSPSSHAQIEQTIIKKLSHIFPQDPEWDDLKPLKRVLFNKEFYLTDN